MLQNTFQMQLVSEKMRNKAKHAKQNVQFINYYGSFCVCALLIRRLSMCSLTCKRQGLEILSQINLHMFLSQKSHPKRRSIMIKLESFGEKEQALKTIETDLKKYMALHPFESFSLEGSRPLAKIKEHVVLGCVLSLASCFCAV